MIKQIYSTLLISSLTFSVNQALANDIEYSSNIQSIEKNKYEQNYTKVRLREKDEDSLIIPYVYNGHDAYLSDFPFYVRLITYYEGDSYFHTNCGGSVLDENHILTAAHCVYNEDLTPLAAVHTDNNAFSYEDLSYFEKVYIHPNYNAINYQNDIAVIKLSKPLVGNYTPISIPDEKEYNIYNSVDDYTVIGMGTIETGKASNQLKQGVVRRKNKIDCKISIESTSNSVFNMDNYICADQIMGTDSCYGDSGGPLTYISNGKYKQIGLVSFGITSTKYNNKCGSPDSFTVYSDIYSQKDFIENSIKGIEIGINPEDTKPEEENNSNTGSSSSSGGSIEYFYILILGFLLILREYKRKKQNY